MILLKRRIFRRRHRRALVYAGLASVCAATLLAILLAMPGEVGDAPVLRTYGDTTSLDATNDSGARLRAAANRTARRLYYPYSLVEGGVRDVAELRARVERDGELAAHYAGFDLERARLVPASAAKFMYVSYRMPSRVFWTSRRMQLARGEMLITDGVHYARARCANRISDEPQEPVAAQEPSVAELDTPREAEELTENVQMPVQEMGPLASESSGTLMQPELDVREAASGGSGPSGGGGSGGLIPTGPSGDRPRKKKGSETPTVPAGGAMPGAGFLVVCGAVLTGYLILKRY